MTAPSDVDTWQAQYNAVRTAVGLVHHTDWGVLSLTGKDRVAFAHGLLSGEIKKLPVGCGGQSFLLDTTGHTRAEVLTLHRADELLLVVPWGQGDQVAAELEKFHISEKVTIANVTRQWAVWGVHGPLAGDLLNAALHVDMAPTAEYAPFEIAVTPAKWPDARSAAATAELTVIGFAQSLTGETGVTLLLPREVDRAAKSTDSAGPPLSEGIPAGPSGGSVAVETIPTQIAEAMAAVLRRAGADLGLCDIGPVALEVLRIEAGVARAPNEINSGVLGPELNRPGAFARGKCYPGQEVVARIEARGHVNKVLMGIVAETGAGPLAVGDEVHLGPRKVATLTSAGYSPRLGWVGLGFVRREANTPGTVVTVHKPACEAGGDQPMAIPAVVRALPMASPIA